MIGCRLIPFNQGRLKNFEKVTKKENIASWRGLMKIIKNNVKT
jgi:hypothetical protein